jgi:hypothetical protein
MDELLKLFTKLNIDSELEVKNAEFALEFDFNIPIDYLGEETGQSIPARMKVQFKGDMKTNFRFG